ncbi:MAG: hypothetical protein QW156_04015 [Candidatus Aenigmatarchaeota archaeon]
MRVIECDVDNAILFEHHNDSSHYSYFSLPDTVENMMNIYVPHASLVFSIGTVELQPFTEFTHRFITFSPTRTYYIDEKVQRTISHNYPQNNSGTVYWAFISLLGGWHSVYSVQNIHYSSTANSASTFTKCHAFALVMPLETQVLNTEARSETSGWVIPSRTYLNNYLFDVNHSNIYYTLANATNVTNNSSFYGITSPNTPMAISYHKVYNSSNQDDSSSYLNKGNSMSYGKQGNTVTTNPTSQPSQGYILLFAKFAGLSNQPTLNVQLKKDVKIVSYNLFDVIKQKANPQYSQWVDNIYQTIKTSTGYISKAQVYNGSETIELEPNSALSKGNYIFNSTYENFIVGVED